MSPVQGRADYLIVGVGRSSGNGGACHFLARRKLDPAYLTSIAARTNRGWAWISCFSARKTPALARIRRLLRAGNLGLAGIRAFARATTLGKDRKPRFMRAGTDHWQSPIALRESASL